MLGFRRKKYLINKKLQLKLVLINISLMIFIALVVGSGIYFTIWKSVIEEFSEIKLASDFETITRIREYESVRQKRMIELLPAIREEAKMLSEQQRYVLNRIIIKSNMNLLPVLLIICMVIFIISIMYTNRLAGPVYRMIKNLKAIEDGDLSQSFKLRRKDELKDLAISIENIIEIFSDTVKKSKIMINNIKKAETEEERNKIFTQFEEIYIKFKI